MGEGREAMGVLEGEDMYASVLDFPVTQVPGRFLAESPNCYSSRRRIQLAHRGEYILSGLAGANGN